MSDGLSALVNQIWIKHNLDFQFSTYFSTKKLIKPKLKERIPFQKGCQKRRNTLWKNSSVLSQSGERENDQLL